MLCESALQKTGTVVNRKAQDWVNIMKTRPCNIQKKFLVVKMKNFIGKNLIFFLIFAQNIDFGYKLEPPQRGGSAEAVLTSFHNLCFGAKIRKIGIPPAYPSFAI